MHMASLLLLGYIDKPNGCKSLSSIINRSHYKKSLCDIHVQDIFLLCNNEICIFKNVYFSDALFVVYEDETSECILGIILKVSRFFH